VLSEKKESTFLVHITILCLAPKRTEAGQPERRYVNKHPGYARYRRVMEQMILWKSWELQEPLEMPGNSLQL